jgi:hypothetical protein
LLLPSNGGVRITKVYFEKKSEGFVQGSDKNIARIKQKKLRQQLVEFSDGFHLMRLTNVF